MNRKSEDFPALIPPTRRMVYGAFALFFAVVTIPCLRKFTRLTNKVRASTSEMLLTLLNRSNMAWASRIIDRVVGKDFGAGRNITDSVIVHDSKFCGKTRCLGSTSTAFNMVGLIL